MKWLSAALERGPVLGDGAMGTMLFRAGLRPGDCGDLWNIERPDTVLAIHTAYAEAGSDFLTANTFGGNPMALARHGLADRAPELNAAGIRIARQAGANRIPVFGDVGPFGGFLEPYGETTEDQLRASLKVQLLALRDEGADGVLVETMVDSRELLLAVKSAKEVSDWPVLASFAFNRMPDGSFRTMMGVTVEEGVRTALSAGANAVGANCGTALSLDDYLDLGRELLEAAGQTPVLLQPNAGSPREVEGGGTIYTVDPPEFGAWARRAVALGVRVVGGCCGTTPDHLRSAVAELGREPAGPNTPRELPADGALEV